MLQNLEKLRTERREEKDGWEEKRRRFGREVNRKSGELSAHKNRKKQQAVIRALLHPQRGKCSLEAEVTMS